MCRAERPGCEPLALNINILPHTVSVCFLVLSISSTQRLLAYPRRDEQNKQKMAYHLVLCKKLKYCYRKLRVYYNNFNHWINYGNSNLVANTTAVCSVALQSLFSPTNLLQTSPPPPPQADTHRSLEISMSHYWDVCNLFMSLSFLLLSSEDMLLSQEVHSVYETSHE